MPFFPKKYPPRDVKEDAKEVEYEISRTTERNGGHVQHQHQHQASEDHPPHPHIQHQPDDPTDKQKLVFYCQQAQGSPTGLISGFTNVKELYQKISECYDFDASEILFCTLNSHKINMGKLLGAQIALGDFIFVHRRGRSKEIELTKTEDALGLTITDNGNGLAFIKRIKEGSVIDNVPVIKVGDHIERIDHQNLVGKRHFEVARSLKEIPKGTTFVLRLVEPIQAGFSNIGPRGDKAKGKKQAYGSGKQTLRFKAGGEAVIEVVDDTLEKAVNVINVILENFLGINDAELATRIWELGEGQTNSMEFAEAIEQSEMEGFGFTEDFIIELWGAITDARDGRL